MHRRSDLVQIDIHDALSEFLDERMASVEVLALPTPAEVRKHVKRHPQVLECNLLRQVVATGHVAVQDNQNRDVERNRGGEECNVREPDKLVVHDDNIVRCDNGWVKIT